ncbi:outer arm dynein light chain 1 [Trametopsis cervina]|nr:outer arm dynein light chain 1 [Trametopsis cervina]
MTQPLSLPEVGMRLAHSGFIGTVKFVGPVDGTQGIWLGVEWDDPKRGKHSGEKDGRTYFSSTIPNAGSFIRPSASISYGISFLEALVAKYTDVPHGETVETVLLGSSNGAIEVEAVGLNKIRANLSRLETLREVSLDNERIARADAPGEIRKTCARVRGLDLSKNLFSSWDVVALIVAELPRLTRLALSHNRLAMPQDSVRFSNAFSTIQELQINSTLIPWIDLKLLISYMPSLTSVECGYNGYATLASQHGGVLGSAPTDIPLRIINLDCNELHDWAHIVSALQVYTNLDRVILSSNRLQVIQEIKDQAPFSQLRHLSLTLNSLKSWSDIDNLRIWCPILESLSLSGNPLSEDPETEKHSRQFTIARIPTLKALDAAAITPKERTDCELFYISHINNHSPQDEAERRRRHPRWTELCDKYGRPDLPQAARETTKQETLANRLFQVNVHQCSQPPNPIPTITKTVSLRVLPTMTLRTFRLKVLKMFDIRKMEQRSVKMWLAMPDGNHIDLASMDDAQDLAWLGFERDSDIFLYSSGT